MPMLTFDPIPQARVVRKGSQLFSPPPAPRSAERSKVALALRETLRMAIGLWPLTGVLLLAMGLLYIAALNGSP
jgi:hypothetical protein